MSHPTDYLKCPGCGKIDCADVRMPPLKFLLVCGVILPICWFFGVGVNRSLAQMPEHDPAIFVIALLVSGCYLATRYANIYRCKSCGRSFKLERPTPYRPGPSDFDRSDIS